MFRCNRNVFILDDYRSISFRAQRASGTVKMQCCINGMRTTQTSSHAYTQHAPIPKQFIFVVANLQIIRNANSFYNNFLLSHR